MTYRPPVYLVKKDCPAPYLVAIHGAIKYVNNKYHGKKKVDQVRFIDLPLKHSKGLYEAVIVFSSYKVSEEFIVAAKARNCADALEHMNPSYAHDRHHFNLKGDGRADIWVAPNDTCIHFTDDDVCQRPWFLRNAKPTELVIKEILFVGCTRGVRDAMRVYKHAKRQARESKYHQYGAVGNVSMGMTETQWERIAKALGYYANMYLFTTQGTVIKVSHGRMEWVRPTKPNSTDYYTRMIYNGYKQFPVQSVLREYSATTHRYPSALEESMITIALTHEAEAERR